MVSLPVVGAMAVLSGFFNLWFSGMAFFMMPVVHKIINSRFAIDTNKMEVIEDGEPESKELLEEPQN